MITLRSRQIKSSLKMVVALATILSFLFSNIAFALPEYSSKLRPPEITEAKSPQGGSAVTFLGNELTTEAHNAVNAVVKEYFQKNPGAQPVDPKRIDDDFGSTPKDVQVFIISELSAFDDVLPGHPQGDALITHEGRGGDAQAHSVKHIYMSPKRYYTAVMLSYMSRKQFWEHALGHLSMPRGTNEEAVQKRYPLNYVLWDLKQVAANERIEREKRANPSTVEDIKQAEIRVVRGNMLSDYCPFTTDQIAEVVRNFLIQKGINFDTHTPDWGATGSLTIGNDSSFSVKYFVFGGNTIHLEITRMFTAGVAAKVYVTRATSARGADKGFITKVEHEELRQWLENTEARSDNNRNSKLEEKLKVKGNIKIYIVPNMFQETGFRGHYAIRDGVVYVDADTFYSEEYENAILYVSHEVYELNEILRYAEQRQWTRDQLVEWLDKTGNPEEVKEVLLDIHNRAPKLPEGAAEIIGDTNVESMDILDNRPVRGAAGMDKNKPPLDTAQRMRLAEGASDFASNLRGEVPTLPKAQPDLKTEAEAMITKVTEVAKKLPAAPETVTSEDKPDTTEEDEEPPLFVGSTFVKNPPPATLVTPPVEGEQPTSALVSEAPVAPVASTSELLSELAPESDYVKTLTEALDKAKDKKIELIISKAALGPVEENPVNEIIAAIKDGGFENLTVSFNQSQTEGQAYISRVYLISDSNIEQFKPYSVYYDRVLAIKPLVSPNQVLVLHKAILSCLALRNLTLDDIIKQTPKVKAVLSLLNSLDPYRGYEINKDDLHILIYPNDMESVRQTLHRIVSNLPTPEAVTAEAVRQVFQAIQEAVKNI